MEVLTISQIIEQVTAKKERVRTCRKIPEDIVTHILLYRSKGLSYRNIKNALELSHPDYDATIYTINKVIDDNLTDEQREMRDEKRAKRRELAAKRKLEKELEAAEKTELDLEDLTDSQEDDVF